MKFLLPLILFLFINTTPSISAEKSDTNGDGYISHEEWMIAGNKRLERQFTAQDKNQDSYLSQEEQKIISLGSRINQSIKARLNQDGSFSIDSVKERAALFGDALVKNKNKFSDYINEQIQKRENQKQ